MIVPAAISPHLISYFRIRPFSPTGMVLYLSTSINMTAINSSFQELIKAKIMLAAIPGLITGTATRNKADRYPHPSIHAASSSDFGTLSKKPQSVTTENGIIMLVYKKARLHRLFSILALANIW